MRLVVLLTDGKAYQHEINSAIGTEWEATFYDVDGNQLTVKLDNNHLILYDRANKKRYRILRWWIE